ncbi:hypothetical protein Pfo_003613 [Paulownia fortunei]|nr:hypothetical protein Pfo_003613 [Paulownia fortunei]
MHIASHVFQGSAFGVWLFVFASASSIIVCSNAGEIDEDNFNVMDYGATSDGHTDDSQAFLEAWDAACSASVESPRVYVPPDRTFLLNPINFHGPCSASRIGFILGTIIAPESPSMWDGRDASQWLGFKDINGLNVDGFGFRQCTKVAPTALKFLWCNESSVRNMNLINSAQTHILVKGCNSFSIDNVIIQSPGNSPNTDGIHIQSSQHVLITNSKIGCGNVECGPGHGIRWLTFFLFIFYCYSFDGIMGRGGNYVQVENIRLTDAFFNGTSNGARIKTWQVSKYHAGYVRDVTFENLIFNYVKNPIIIDQNYCNVRNACKELVRKNYTKVDNVIYKEVAGTSTTYIAINLNCSKSVPCFGISMESVQLTAIVGKQVTANCSNAYGQEVDVVPGPCLLH